MNQVPLLPFFESVPKGANLFAKQRHHNCVPQHEHSYLTFVSLRARVKISFFFQPG
ncbi:hypothetical protein THOG10_340016 [Vibrio rotiferianus]|nr:hypothetical protein THOG10_340016 [Vibrio rotiferianus]